MGNAPVAVYNTKQSFFYTGKHDTCNSLDQKYEVIISSLLVIYFYFKLMLKQAK